MRQRLQLERRNAAKAPIAISNAAAATNLHASGCFGVARSTGSVGMNTSAERSGVDTRVEGDVAYAARAPGRFMTAVSGEVVVRRRDAPIKRLVDLDRHACLLKLKHDKGEFVCTYLVDGKDFPQVAGRKGSLAFRTASEQFDLFFVDHAEPVPFSASVALNNAR